jgi:hypothetical protein
VNKVANILIIPLILLVIYFTGIETVKGLEQFRSIEQSSEPVDPVKPQDIEYWKVSGGVWDTKQVYELNYGYNVKVADYNGSDIANQGIGYYLGFKAIPDELHFTAEVMVKDAQFEGSSWGRIAFVIACQTVDGLKYLELDVWDSEYSPVKVNKPFWTADVREGVVDALKIGESKAYTFEMLQAFRTVFGEVEITEIPNIYVVFEAKTDPKWEVDYTVDNMGFKVVVNE